MTQVICDGEKRVIEIPGSGKPPFDEGYRIIVTAGGGGSSSLPQSVFALIEGVWNAALGKIHALRNSTFALINSLALSEPSCTQIIAGENGEGLSVTRYQDHIFIHPTIQSDREAFEEFRLPAEEDDTLSQSVWSVLPSIRQSIKLKTVDLMYPIGSSVVWYRYPGETSMRGERIGSYTQGNLNGVVEWLSQRGVTASCRQEGPLPERFQWFLNQLPPRLTITSLSSTTTNGEYRR